MRRGVGVHRRQHIIEQQQTRTAVHRPREGDPRLLAAGKGDTLLADFGLVAVFEEGEVRGEGAGGDDGGVAGFAVGEAEDDVGADVGALRRSNEGEKKGKGKKRKDRQFQPAKREDEGAYLQPRLLRDEGGLVRSDPVLFCEVTVPVEGWEGDSGG